MKLNRRAFLLTAASATRILGANDRIRVGAIGVGGRGAYDVNMALKAENTQLVAVSDVYAPRLQEVQEMHNCEGIKDYRALLDRKDIDAVIIGSPDHWHVQMILDSIAAGKDAYCEKPVSHSIEEGEKLLKAGAASKQIVQVGYQQRSWAHYHQARELFLGGRLGDVPLIETSWYQRYSHTVKPSEASAIDWKAFLGSAPDQPFDPQRRLNWRWFWDFGGGHLTDLFSHWVDVIHWYTNEYSPLTAEMTGTRNGFPEYQCPDTVSATYEYPKGYNVLYAGSLGSAVEDGNIIFRGTQATMKLNRWGYAVYDEGGRTSALLPPPALVVQSPHDGSVDHMQNFLDCVRSRKIPNAPLTTSVASAKVAHLGNLAYRKKALA